MKLLFRAVALLEFLCIASAFGQQVTRSFVAFEKYFYEIDPTNQFGVLTFSASQQNEYDVVVSYQTVDGTAVAGRDYQSVTGEVTFAAGSTNRTASIPVPLLNSTNVADRTFTVKLNASFPAEVSQLRGEVPVTIIGRPALIILRGATNVVLRWRASATNYVLQTRKLDSLSWTTVSGAPRQFPDNPNQSLALPIEPESALFRLGTL